MKTKIVYVVASLDKDIYMEQAIVSAWSARYYNPDCQIEMVCDQDTFATLESGIRAQYKNLFNKIHKRRFLPEQDMKERSRWMKTSVRDIVHGDYLYLDTDTVVCADLSYVDDFDFEIGMVLDCNCQFRSGVAYEWVVPKMKEMYNMDVSDEVQYYNSGVMFVRDCQNTHEFCQHWNELWKYSFRSFDDKRDQQPLMKANKDMNYLIKELSGDLNCQVALSIQYLHTAHVVHFFNNMLGRSEDLSPLFKDLFIQVKRFGLTEDIKIRIIKCKSSFSSPSMPLTHDNAILWRHYLTSKEYNKFRPYNKYEKEIINSNSYYVISYIWYNFPNVMHIIDVVLEKMISILKKIKYVIKK